MKKLFEYTAAIALCFSLALTAGGQTIYGTLQPDSSWQQKVYVLKFDSWTQFMSGSSKNVVDSTIMDAHGHFRIEIKGAISNELLRVNVIPKGETSAGLLINNFSSDNYAFIYVTSKNSLVKLDGKMSELFNSFNITTSDPVGRSFNQIMKMRQSYSNRIQAIIREGKFVPKDIYSLVRQHNDSLRTLLRKETNPLLQLSGASFLFSDVQDRLRDSALYIDFLQRASKKNGGHKYVQTAQVAISDALFTLPVGRAVPAIVYTSTLEKQTQYDPTKSELTIIDFWATWCKPCIAEAQTTLKSLSNIYGTDKLNILGLNVDESPSSWTAFLSSHSYPWVNGYLVNGFNNEIAQQFKVKELPRIYVINSKGIIVAKDLKGDQLAEFIASVLKKHEQL